MVSKKNIESIKKESEVDPISSLGGKPIVNKPNNRKINEINLLKNGKISKNNIFFMISNLYFSLFFILSIIQQ